jgi:signal transduction histidine kinase
MTRRLLLTYVSLTAVVLAVLVVPLGVVNARNEQRDLSAKVERDAVAVASLAEDALEAGSPRPVPALRRLADGYLARTGGRIVVVDADGTSVVDPAAPTGRSFASRPEIGTALAGNVASGTRGSETLGTDLLYVAVPVASGGVVHGAVRITYPTSELASRVRRYWLLLGAIAAVVLALAALLGLRLARWTSRPLQRVEEAAERVGAGDLSVRAPVEGPVEVRALAQEFNETVGKLEALVGSQREFVADASHQLRTPLTAVRLRLENLEREVTPGGRADLDAALAELDRLSELVEALLALARTDAEVAPAGSLDTGALVRERVDAWSALAEERGATVEADVEPVPAAHAARERVEQALDNLIANALEASPSGGRVVVGARLRGGRIELTVSDDGPGLKPDERSRAFDRFWRRRDSPGSGLGLPIAKRLLEIDGATIELRDGPRGGLEAAVVLQRAIPR